MGDKSQIEWTDATWNPVTGCTKVSQGCKHCYAERVFPRPYPGRAFTDVRCHPERLEQPLRWAKPRRIFVNSMSDLFHEDVPEEFINRVFAVILRAHHHTFQILTKRPQRMLDYMDFRGRDGRVYLAAQRVPLCARADLPHWPPRNVWLGVSIEDQATADFRIPLLLRTPAAVRFLSCEPLLGPIDLSGWLSTNALHEIVGGPRIDWVIAGGESGPKARPSHPDWFRSLRDQCAAGGAAFFFKQWGEWVSVSEVAGDGSHHRFDDGATVRRIGKKHAGRTLDGRTHDELPA